MRTPNRRLGAVCQLYDVNHLPRRRVRTGTNNAHWFVGDSLVLRRYSGLRSVTMIDYEHGILDQLHLAGWPVAAPLRTSDGRTTVVDEGRHYALFPRLPGRPGRGGRARDPRALGRLLARLHNDIEPIAERVVAPPPPAVFPPAFAIVVDPIWEHLDALPDPAMAAGLRRALDRLAEDIAGVDRGDVRSGIVHGEWGDAQLLYRAGKVTGVLDFDFVHPDFFAVDPGIATMTTDVPVSTEIIAGYRAERGLSTAELAVVGLAQRAGRLGYIWPSLNAIARGDATAVENIRIQFDAHNEAEHRWPALLAAIG